MSGQPTSAAATARLKERIGAATGSMEAVKGMLAGTQVTSEFERSVIEALNLLNANVKDIEAQQSQLGGEVDCSTNTNSTTGCGDVSVVKRGGNLPEYKGRTFCCVRVLLVVSAIETFLHLRLFIYETMRFKRFKQNN